MIRPRPRPATLVGLVILLCLVLMAVLAPLLTAIDPEAVNAERVLGSPTPAHPLGSDTLGRDVAIRLLFALRTSLAIAIGSVVVATVLALPLGVIAGYAGGWVDSAITRPLDMLLVLPALLLAISLIAILGPGSLVAALAIALIYLPILARVMRASALVVTGTEYVEAARARGRTPVAIVIDHVLPNALGPVIVQAFVLTGFALQIEAALSFLGLGTQPPTPSLGLMLAEGRGVLNQAPWIGIYPGLAVALTVLALNLIGDGLRRRLDPAGVSA